jgi:uncharacterized protein (DUF362 family)
MSTRRYFLKTAALAGSAFAVDPIRPFASRYQTSSGFFGVHPFIENHPESVFIMRTDVDVKTNSSAKLQAGLAFGRSVFVPREKKDGGMPLTHTIAIKPNLTTRGQGRGYTTEGTMGIITDANFVEGIIEGLKELGISSGQIFIRETNTNTGEMDEGGYSQMAVRTGVSLKVNSLKVGVISENELVWVDAPPECMWFRKIPYLWPFNAPDAFFISVAKFKSHGMGLTLAGKNIQGTLCHDYQELCSGYHSDGSGDMNIDRDHFKADAHSVMRENYERHRADGVPRWDRPGSIWNSGLGMERWATRTIDNHLSSKIGLHIVEGVYGRDGNGFTAGPHQADGSLNLNSSNGLGRDYMTNIIIFGKNPFHVDVIGHWLGGHEPGNMGYLHLALERGMATWLDPFRIPVYEWFPTGAAVLTPLAGFKRTPLLTYYLQRNYGGNSEPYWHMVDEPFDYGSITAHVHSTGAGPDSFVLKQNIPNPFNPCTSIEFYLPADGYARLEVFNNQGQLVDVLVDSHLSRGSHLAVWRTDEFSSGTYFYRFRSGSFTSIRKMMLLR